jgi:hypothetical protein
VMGVIEILSDRREYTKLNPFVVLLGRGDHPITTHPTYGSEYATMLTITRSNITFLGAGKDTTTISGGFRIDNLDNITFKNMTVTFTSDIGCGLRLNNAKVELFDVAFTGCTHGALFIPPSPPSVSPATTLIATRCEFANSRVGAAVNGSLTSATFNNCLFHSNEETGLKLCKSTIHLHGEDTAIHSNGTHGIWAHSSGKVIIHLPSHHNTFYNNGEEDRYTYSGGTITNVE